VRARPMPVSSARRGPRTSAAAPRSEASPVKCLGHGEAGLRSLQVADDAVVFVLADQLLLFDQASVGGLEQWSQTGLDGDEVIAVGNVDPTGDGGRPGQRLRAQPRIDHAAQAEWAAEGDQHRQRARELLAGLPGSDGAEGGRVSTHRCEVSMPLSR